MRTEQEMVGLLLGVARQDERIRSVVLNGSRANPAAPRDLFQDFDVVYFVRAYETFLTDPGWIDRFGRRIMLQMPETMRWPSNEGTFSYLILLEDGNRIDLTLFPAERLSDNQKSDSESIVLLDKDGVLPEYPPASDADYRVKPPSVLYFDSCCNNFWWCTQNVAKGLWRDEIPYATAMYEGVLRKELHDMIAWRIGVDHGFSVATGKDGKYFKRFLSEPEYAMLMRTYSDSDAAHLWEALSTMCELFRKMALRVAERTGLTYPCEDDRRMMAHLECVRRLPKDAVSWTTRCGGTAAGNPLGDQGGTVT
jgi:aminoglycoside 6-adenylyltransferase